MKLFNLTRTSDSCPAQWEATNEQGQGVYIRYRFDSLTVHCPFQPDNEDYEAFMAAQILTIDHVFDDAYRGVLDTSEMLALTDYQGESRRHRE